MRDCDHAQWKWPSDKFERTWPLSAVSHQCFLFVSCGQISRWGDVPPPGYIEAPVKTTRGKLNFLFIIQITAMGKKALLIAIEETKNRPDLGLSSLPFAHRDAHALYTCLISHVTITWPFSECSLLTSLTGDHGYQQDDVVLMLDSPKFPEHLQPTGSNIVSQTFRCLSMPALAHHYHLSDT